MVVKEYLKTRKDGVKLYRSYSDANKYIKKIGTEEVYSEAVDVESATFEYEEIDKEIETRDENLSVNEAMEFVKGLKQVMVKK